VRKEDAAGQRIKIRSDPMVPVYTGEVGKRLKEKGSQNKKNIIVPFFAVFSSKCHS
jgi:hypothetical protein